MNEPRTQSADGSVRKGRSEAPLNERLLSYLRGMIELEGPMPAEDVARLLGFANPEKSGARKAREYLKALEHSLP